MLAKSELLCQHIGQRLLMHSDSSRGWWHKSAELVSFRCDSCMKALAGWSHAWSFFTQPWLPRS